MRDGRRVKCKTQNLIKDKKWRMGLVSRLGKARGFMTEKTFQGWVCSWGWSAKPEEPAGIGDRDQRHGKQARKGEDSDSVGLHF